MGDREAVRIFHPDNVDESGSPTGGGGTTTTIDVGGGENDDFESNSITDVDSMTPSEYFESFYWNDLPAHIQQAYTVLGYDAVSWDEGYPIPDSEYLDWDELTDEMQQAAIVLGYDQESWDGGRRLERRMEKIQFYTASDIFGDLRIVDEDGDEEAQGDATTGSGGVQILMDPETYTRSFCTDGE